MDITNYYSPKTRLLEYEVIRHRRHHGQPFTEIQTKSTHVCAILPRRW